MQSAFAMNFKLISHWSSTFFIFRSSAKCIQHSWGLVDHICDHLCCGPSLNNNTSLGCCASKPQQAQGCSLLLSQLTWNKHCYCLCSPYFSLQIHSSANEPVELQSWFQRGTVQRRSSYAVSQGRGFGKLITTGVGLPSAAPGQDGRVMAEGLKNESPQDLHIEMNSAGVSC